jgi:hypothetical protein
VQSFGDFASTCVTTQLLPDNPSPPTLSTVSSALGYFRSTKPLIPYAAPAGTTGVQIYDVFVEDFANALEISP